MLIGSSLRGRLTCGPRARKFVWEVIDEIKAQDNKPAATPAETRKDGGKNA